MHNLEDNIKLFGQERKNDLEVSNEDLAQKIKQSVADQFLETDFFALPNRNIKSNSVAQLLIVVLIFIFSVICWVYLFESNEIETQMKEGLVRINDNIPLSIDLAHNDVIVHKKLIEIDGYKELFEKEEKP